MKINLEFSHEENVKATVLAVFARMRFPDASVSIQITRLPLRAITVTECGRRLPLVERRLEAEFRALVIPCALTQGEEHRR
jgi:hypothetical protein